MSCISRYLIHLAQSRLISPHLAPSRPISPHLASSRLISPHLASPRLISPHLAPSRPISPHLASSRLISPHLASSRLISPHPPHLGYSTAVAEIDPRSTRDRPEIDSTRPLLGRDRPNKPQSALSPFWSRVPAHRQLGGCDRVCAAQLFDSAKAAGRGNDRARRPVLPLSENSDRQRILGAW